MWKSLAMVGLRKCNSQEKTFARLLNLRVIIRQTIFLNRRKLLLVKPREFLTP
jgi:hypothetical protein